MAKFIKCSCENTIYRGNEIQNDPINIELVSKVSKIQECYYPDNTGTPAIKFYGVDETWVYGYDQLKERDADYEMIVNNNF